MAKPGFLIHRKFRRLVGILKMPAPHILGHIECLWGTAYATGNPFVGDSVDVESAAQWTGEAGKFTEALLKCGGTTPGLIDPSPEDSTVFVIHDFAAHCPSYVKERGSKRAENEKPKTCADCKGTFYSPDARAKYCCDACCQKSYRDRNAKQDKKDSSLPTVTDPVTYVGNTLPKVTDVTDPLPAFPDQTRPDQTLNPIPPAAAGGKEAKPEKKADRLSHVPLPFELNTPEFSEAWGRWLKHRREIRHALKPTSEAAALAGLKAMGPQRAIAMIDYTILKGWQGLVEPPQASGPGPNRASNTASLVPAEWLAAWNRIPDRPARLQRLKMKYAGNAGMLQKIEKAIAGNVDSQSLIEEVKRMEAA